MMRSLSTVLASLKITVWTLLWIAAMCIVATFVPQQACLTREGMPGKDLFFSLLSISHMFQSLWFVIPTVILTLNLSACMLIRIRADRAFPRMPPQCSQEVNVPAEADPAGMRGYLAAQLCRGFHTREQVQGSSWVIHGEKNRLRRIAPLLLHLSVLSILMGAWLGMLGFNASMQIEEGQSIDKIKYDSGEVGHLPFKLRCDGFRVDYYENGMPREYRSELAFIKSGRDLEKRPVLVNHPVSFDGILFSQSAFDVRRIATIAIESAGPVRRAVAGENTFFLLDENGYNRVHVVRMMDNVMNLGPAVELMVETPQGKRPLWLFKNIDRMRSRFPDLYEQMPELNPSFLKPYTLALETMENRYITVLSLNKDPGAMLVAASALLFLAALLVLFLVPRNRIWISMEQTGDKCTIKVVHLMGEKTCVLDKETLEILHAAPGVRP